MIDFLTKSGECILALMDRIVVDGNSPHVFSFDVARHAFAAHDVRGFKHSHNFTKNRLYILLRDGLIEKSGDNYKFTDAAFDSYNAVRDQYFISDYDSLLKRGGDGKAV